ncbi:MAG: hypothetical protein ABIE68_03805, partial [bacterium]
MIIVKLYAGLGNQLFQYGLGRSLAEKNNTVLKVDTNWFTDNQNQLNRKYELNKFKTNLDIANKKEINRIQYKNNNILNIL